MKINYYNSVKVQSNVEQPISFSRKLDEWGTALIEPYQASYRGHSFTVIPSSGEIIKFTPLFESPIKPKEELSILAKIRVIIGTVFKKIAAFFNSEIKAKYCLIENHQNPHYDSFGYPVTIYYDSLQPPRKITVRGEGGNGNIECLCEACVCCFECCVGMASICAGQEYTPSRRRY